MVKHLTIERIVSIKKNDDAWDLKFWQKSGALARFSATWKMVEDLYRIKGKKHGSKYRLQRSVQNIERFQG